MKSAKINDVLEYRPLTAYPWLPSLYKGLSILKKTNSICIHEINKLSSRDIG